MHRLWKVIDKEQMLKHSKHSSLYAPDQLCGIPYCAIQGFSACVMARRYDVPRLRFVILSAFVGTIQHIGAQRHVMSALRPV